MIVDNEVSLALAMANIISESLLKETCNSIDDDCNGQCDENWPEVAVTGAACTNTHAAQTCTAGLGICKRTGTYVCKSDGSGSVCNVTAGPPNPGGEICSNGLDDDCDGAVDEGCQPCVPQPEICNGKDDDCDGAVDEGYVSVACGSNIGECAQGTTACVGGKVVCNGATPPSTELCDNKDNNCDTIVDSFSQVCYPPSTGCSTGTGVCQGVCQVGSRLCTNGTWGGCLGYKGPTTESCNGLDDDCDGTVDEGVSNTCTNYGTCASYVTCSACQAKPAEICDGVDNDCNGSVDDNALLVGTACGAAVGECKKGTWACVNGGLVCQGGTGPQTEICDGLDNDCDGKIDDNITGLGGTCGTSVGECTPGTWQCIGKKVVCAGGVTSTAEVCDGKDNDCDGQTDEGIPSLKCGSDVGECTQGTTACVGGKVTCSGGKGPSAELCNGLDDDCNGVADDAPTDEGKACGSAVGQCAQGVTKCINKALICTGQAGPKTEICDGLDNDCNGSVDDKIAGSGATCGTSVGECKAGNLACVLVLGTGWTMSCVGSVGPISEICNGLDDDCDAQTDETFPQQGQTCGTNIGECKSGTYVCEQGKVVCKGSVGSTAEICDGKDNDCNGAIDDNVPGEGAACGSSVGECKPGKTKCVGGKIICIGGTGPTAEICDGKDNDCDGQTDEMAECPGASVCIEGKCLVPCKQGEFVCPGGTKCKNGYCVSDKCAAVTCKDTERCVDGACISKCSGVVCDSHEKCDAKTGQCVDDSCVSKGCPGDKVCAGYTCVDDPCPPGKCPTGQICSEGKCYDTCANVTCPAGQTCVLGSCTSDPCAKYPCEATHTCEVVNGKPQCVPDPCRLVSCVKGQVCHQGKCIGDPCATTDCPEGFRCVVSNQGQADCEEIPGYPIPTTNQMLATGAGGCACQLPGQGGAGAGGALFPLLLGLLWTLRRRLRARSSRRGSRGGLAALLGLLVLFTAACEQDPFEIVNRVDIGNRDSGPSWFDASTGDDATSDAITEGGGGDACVKTGVEVCDGKDNDCNGAVDDVSQSLLESDANNCGKCNNKCVYTNAFGKCVKGSCELDTCAPGYNDADKNWTNGCEYQCLVTNGGVETCDNADNDCDQLVDEDFNTQTDVDNCGACNNKCLYNHAAPKCDQGKCKLDACDSGYVDLNSTETDGCEYQCPVWPAVAEVCNGKDDDCDKQVDEGAPGSGKVCDTGLLGECKAGTTQCTGGKLGCQANATSSQEICDGKDNDCDGQTDEDYNLSSNPLHCGTCNKKCSYANAVPICDNKICKLDKCLPGYKDNDADWSNGCEKKCPAWPLSIEKCNGIDDDCDGQTDEDFDTKTDTNHCGVCNKKCSYVNAQAQCVGGTCQMGNCATDYYDINKATSDGCEYFCVKSNGGVEVCDNVDNDCDGAIDDGFNLQGDVKNCGTCGTTCSFINAATSCVAGKCVMGACTTGYKNLNNQTADGCEYKCPIWPVKTTDGCNGADDDCDGSVDEDFSSSSCGTATGECTAGTNACIGGTVICQGGTGPSAEICDNKDNDCDGSPDEDFNKLTDPRYCGAACVQCALPHAIANCTAGVCGIAVCLNGWVDLDKVKSNGCEYNCTKTGVEICDGLDNDCNGKTDAADTGMVPLGGNPCAWLGECAGSAASCQGSNGWVCNYKSTVELKACVTSADCTSVACNSSGRCPGELTLEETTCDSKDNDCDGLSDEVFTDKGNTCYETGKQGICQGSGTRVCNAAGTATVCTITTPGLAAKDELCNGKDDDCDGAVDEETDDAAGKGVVDAMVHIARTYNSTSYNFYVYSYEASRPDASASSSGSNTTRACSKVSVLPWGNVTYAQALAACTAAGKRLCTATEWYLACSGAPTSTTVYPWGNVYGTGNQCNGKDYYPTKDEVFATGTASTCVSTDMAYDLAGNLKEWTNDPKSDGTPPDPDGYTVRGGAYDTSFEGLKCNNTFAVMPASFYFPNLGFRCCSNTAP